MSNFPFPELIMPATAKLDEMNRTYLASMPKELAGTVNLMVHPVAGAAAFSALSLGLASHVFGVWVGAVVGAAEASQRLLATGADGDARGSRAGARPRARRHAPRSRSSRRRPWRRPPRRPSLPRSRRC